MSGRTRTGLTVSREPFREVLPEIMELLNSTRSRRFEQQRFEWLYGGNPDGDAVVWTLRDVGTGRTVGYTAALPRRMNVDGRTRICWNGADFSMHPSYRTLWPACRLRKAAQQGTDAGRCELFYSHPNDRMALIHQRVGLSMVGHMVRYAMPLRMAPYLQERRWNGLLLSGARAADEAVIRVRRIRRHARGGPGIRLMSPAVFDPRFDELFERHRTARRIIGVRDARYLNWRYAQNPLESTHAVVAEEGNRLRGYLLYTHAVEDNTAYVKDVFPPDDGETTRGLIATLVGEGDRRRWKSVSIVALESHPLLPVFEAAGFRRRPETSRMFGYARPGAEIRDAIADDSSWYITLGDRDV